MFYITHDVLQMQTSGACTTSRSTVTRKRRDGNGNNAPRLPHSLPRHQNIAPRPALHRRRNPARKRPSLTDTPRRLNPPRSSALMMAASPSCHRTGRTSRSKRADSTPPKAPASRFCIRTMRQNVRRVSHSYTKRRFPICRRGCRTRTRA